MRSYHESDVFLYFKESGDMKLLVNMSSSAMSVTGDDSVHVLRKQAWNSFKHAINGSPLQRRNAASQLMVLYNEVIRRCNEGRLAQTGDERIEIANLTHYIKRLHHQLNF
jgi:hypothetical protein